MGILSKLGLAPREVARPDDLRGLTVELSSHCGYDCAPCPLNFYTENVKRQHADAAQLIAAMEQNAPLDVVDFTGWGEGLLHPDLISIVEAAAKSASDVTLTTAGSLLTEEKARALIDAGLTYLMVSLDCASAQTYRALKHKDEFDLVCENVKRLAGLRSPEGRPTISLSFVVMQDNLDEARAFAQLAAELGADQIVFKSVVPFEQAEVSRSLDSHYYSGLDPDLSIRAQRTLAEAIDIAMRAGLEVATFGDFRSSRRHPCMAYAEERPFVRADGAVSPCCMAAYPVWRVPPEGEARRIEPVTFGNLTKDALGNTWVDKDYKKFRNDLGDPNGELPDACRDCPICHNFKLVVRRQREESEAVS